MEYVIIQETCQPILGGGGGGRQTVNCEKTQKHDVAVVWPRAS